MGNKKEKRRIIYEATERGFVIGAIHSGIGGEESDRFEITEPLHFAGWHLYGGEAGCIYTGGRWAKIITPAKKLLFITEDGVKMYGGEQYWFFSTKWVDPRPISSRAQACDLSDCNIRFSTLKAAQDWIEKQKTKQKEAELVKEAEKRGLIDGAKYKWDNNKWIHLPERIIKYPMHVNSKGDLCDFMSNIISANGEWPTVITEPKPLKPEELVEGEIYFSKEDPYQWLFRFSCIMPDDRIGTNYARSYSMIACGNRFLIGCNLVFSDRSRTCRPATLLEKQKLVKAEVANNFYYGLK